MLLTGLTGVTIVLIAIGISNQALAVSPALPYVVLSMTLVYLGLAERIRLWLVSDLSASSTSIS